MNSLWKREVALSLVSLLGNTDLVIYTLNILKPLQRDYEEQNARDFHVSLRTSNFSLDPAEERDQSIPVGFHLPFNGGMWRASKINLLKIRYFRQGFMHVSSTRPNHGMNRDVEIYGHQCISDKAKTINNIYAVNFRWSLGYSITEIEEALYDYEHLVDDYGGVNFHQNDLPLLVTTHPLDAHHSSFITIVN